MYVQRWKCDNSSLLIWKMNENRTIRSHRTFACSTVTMIEKLRGRSIFASIFYHLMIVASLFCLSSNWWASNIRCDTLFFKSPLTLLLNLRQMRFVKVLSFGFWLLRLEWLCVVMIQWFCIVFMRSQFQTEIGIQDIYLQRYQRPRVASLEFSL